MSGRADVVRLLAAGRTAQQVADALSVPLAVVRAYDGDPDVAAARRHPPALQESRMPTTLHRPPAAPGSRLAVAPAPQPAKNPPHTSTAVTGSADLDQLLNRAARSSRPATRKQGQRLADLVADLHARLAEEERHARQVEQERLQRAQAAARVAELEQQLAEARAAASPSRRKPKVRQIVLSEAERQRRADSAKANAAAVRARQADLPAAEIRAWGQQRGYTTTGSILSTRLVEAWRAAHPEGQAS